MQDDADDPTAVELRGGPGDPPPSPSPVARGAWVVLVAVGLSLGILLLQAGRVVAGATDPFGGGEQPGLHDRLVLLVFTVGPDARLLLPLAGLSAVAWLTRQAATGSTAATARRVAVALAALLAAAAAALTGVLLYLLLAPVPGDGLTLTVQDSTFDSFAPSCASAVLLVALSVLLVGVLRHREPVAPPPPPGAAASQPAAAPTVEDADPTGPDPEAADPHARFRPPDVRGDGSRR